MAPDLDFGLRPTLVSRYTCAMDEQSVLDGIRYELSRRRVTQRSLERRFGWTRGYLSAVLGRHLDLKLKVLFQLLEGFELSPAEFFAGIEERETWEKSRRSRR
jgi:transcriptional regulator with XRE-family HTH domain